MTKRIALLTGAAGGIGQACAQMLASTGHAVVMVDRNPQVHAIARELGERHSVATLGLVADLTQEDEVSAVARDALAWQGHVDILINNAGIHPKMSGHKFTLDAITNAQWAEVFAVNVTAPFILTRELLPQMQARGWGRIINNASTSGRTGRLNASASYASSKHALIGLTRSAATEAGLTGVTVNAIAPGPVLTDRIRNAPEFKAGSAQMVRYGLPQEIAAVIAFVASDAASYVNGAVFDVNGGTVMV